MRLHRLQVTAFGPYAGTEVVDFDELNDAGVFLLTGPTGAGKSTILDAVCFALYGVVPGERGVKTLRSHHAGPGVRPEVVLELTLGARRYRIRRSPEWTRAKRRGAGTTRENASASLMELTDGEERLVSARAAEVGHTLGELLGMGSEQFMQVVLLPQGEFQTFLTASTDERQALLQRLFRTQRFGRIEDWVHDHSRSLAAAAAGGERQVTQLLAALVHRAGTEPPAGITEALAEGRVADVVGPARAWADALTRAAAEAHEEAAANEREQRSLLEAAEGAAATAVRLAAAHDRRGRALATIERLTDDAAAAATDRSRLESHRRARALAPLLEQLCTLRERHRARSDEWERAVAAVAELLPGCGLAAAEAPRPDAAHPALGAGPNGGADLYADPDRDLDACRSAQARLEDEIAALRAAVRREEGLTRLRAELTSTRGTLDDLDAQVGRLRGRLQAIPAEARRLEEECSAARRAAAGLDDARRRAAEAGRRHEAAAGLEDAEDRHAALVRAAQEARDRAADARERHLAVVERRLAGMAAELAGQLVPGEPCCVCGGLEHPTPATPAEGHASAESQRRAHAEAEERRVEHERLARQVDAAARERAALHAVAEGRSTAEAADLLRAARAAVAEATEAGAAVVRLDRRREQTAEEEAALRDRLRSAEERRGGEQGRLRTLEAQEAEVVAEVAAAVGEPGASAHESLRRHEEAHQRVCAAVASGTARAASAGQLAEVAAAADAAARRHGLRSATESLASLLDDADAEALEGRLRARDEQLMAAEATLGEAEVSALPPGPRPDPDAAARAVAEARDRSRTATAALATTAESLADLGRLRTRLEEAAAAWEPARVRHTTADGVARLVRGTAADNQLQMRLSSYVLATRLDQVLDAANERLGHLRDQRYSLRRTGQARAGRRAGLGLEVHDAWTGEVRSPATLSGGETFVVSLALALGLADVVTAESGGLRVDTLFVDEGFGMLDPDTLDDVMDRIDALRAGGRTVGVVSHVTELRARIPTQVHVRRGRTGSRIEVRTLVP